MNYRIYYSLSAREHQLNVAKSIGNSPALAEALLENLKKIIDSLGTSPSFVGRETFETVPSQRYLHVRFSRDDRVVQISVVFEILEGDKAVWIEDVVIDELRSF